MSTVRHIKFRNAEYDVSNILRRKYIYGPGVDEPICMIEAAGSYAGTYYYHFDALGSVVGLTNASGNTVEVYEYDVYGRLGASDASHPNRILITGRKYDKETGLYYYRARYYNPQIGRFLQTDPVGYGAGMNLYTYCRNNPLVMVDPSGRTFIPTIMIPSAFVTGIHWPLPDDWFRLPDPDEIWAKYKGLTDKVEQGLGTVSDVRSAISGPGLIAGGVAAAASGGTLMAVAGAALIIEGCYETAMGAIQIINDAYMHDKDISDLPGGLVGFVGWAAGVVFSNDDSEAARRAGALGDLVTIGLTPGDLPGLMTDLADWGLTTAVSKLPTSQATSPADVNDQYRPPPPEDREWERKARERVRRPIC